MKEMITTPGKGTMSIEAAVCRQYGTTMNKIISKCRLRELVDARRILVWYYVHECRMNQSEAGRLINRDHATARNLLLTFNVLNYSDKLFHNGVMKVLAMVSPYSKEDHKPRYSRMELISFSSLMSGLETKVVEKRLKEIEKDNNMDRTLGT